MRGSRILLSGIALVALACATPAFADSCTSLSGKTLCLSFKYSTGGSNSYTTTFSGGNINVGGSSPGTYTCVGKNFTDVAYAFGGAENQSWYAKATNAGNGLKGNGKSLTNGYLYSFTSSPGACALERAPGASQRE